MVLHMRSANSSAVGGTYSKMMAVSRTYGSYIAASAGASASVARRTMRSCVMKMPLSRC